MPFNPMIADSIAQSYREALTSGNEFRKRTLDNIDKMGGAVVSVVKRRRENKENAAAEATKRQQTLEDTASKQTHEKDLMGMKLQNEGNAKAGELQGEFHRWRGAIGEQLATKNGIPSTPPEDKFATQAMIGQMQTIASQNGIDFRQGVENRTKSDTARGMVEGQNARDELRILEGIE